MKSDLGVEGNATAVVRATPMASEPPSRLRRQVHGGASPALSQSLRETIQLEPEDDAESSVAGARNWRGLLLGILIGLVIVLMLIMKWLMDHQVEAAAQRHLQELAVRAQAVRCFDQPSHQAANACLKNLETKNNSTE